MWASWAAAVASAAGRVTGTFAIARATRQKPPPLPHASLKPLQAFAGRQFHESGALHRISKRNPCVPQAGCVSKIAPLRIDKGLGQGDVSLPLRRGELAKGDAVDFKLSGCVIGGVGRFAITISDRLTRRLVARRGQQLVFEQGPSKVGQGSIEFGSRHERPRKRSWRPDSWPASPLFAEPSSERPLH